MPLSRRATMIDLAASALLLAAPGTSRPAVACGGWREPPRTYPGGVRWTCAATGWTDGDTLTAVCDGLAGPVAVRVRRVDAAEHGDAGWREAREELRRRTEGRALVVAPHHDSHRRVVVDVLAGGVNVGAAMDAAGRFEPGELNRVGFRWYERFRPEVPADVRGWGAKGELDPETIRRAAD